MKHHLAIIKRPYADLILAGAKQIECRMGRGPYRPPWGCVATGDRIWLKVPAGPVVAVARAGRLVEFPQLDSDQVRSIRRQFGVDIAAPAAFWAAKAGARWAILVWLECVRAVEPYFVDKRDRRGWVLLDGAPRPVARTAIEA